MSIKKEVIEKQLSGVITDASYLKNIQIFGNEIVVDIEIENPTLQYKNKLEKDCKEALNKYEANLELKINFIVRASKPTIKGNPIPGVKNIIAVSSGKGGVGKSTVAANVAVGLSEKGYKVGLVDADIYGPSVHIMFDLIDGVPESIEVNGKKKIKPLESYGVKVLSIGFFTKSNQAVVWRGPMASKALNQLIWDAHWGELDFLIVDLPPGTGDIHLSLVQAIPVTGALIVSTPQNIALADARKGVQMFQMDSISVPVLGIIENMSYFSPMELPENKYYIFGKDGAKGLAEEMKVKLLASIPIVQSIREAADAGRPAVLQMETEVGKAFLNLCDNIIDSVQARNKNNNPTESVKVTHNKGCSN